MAFITEAEIEAALLEQLQDLGYARLADRVAGPDGASPERRAAADVILAGRLEQAVARLNPDIPSGAREDALKKVMADESQSLIAENRRLHRAMVDGVNVEFYAEDGTIRGDWVRLIDFDDPDNNDWLVMDQFTVIKGDHNRRPDVVVFVNGMPLGVIELKNPGAENATLIDAYHQLQTYKAEISPLFRTNAVLVISDGVKARIGSLTAEEERFMPWRTTDGARIADKKDPEMPVLIEGVFEKRRFLDLIRDFTVFGGPGHETKIIAGYHQFHAVQAAVKTTLRALPHEDAPPPGADPGANHDPGPNPDYGPGPDHDPGPGLREDPAEFGLPDARDHPAGDRRIGVIWHTQGSGKSLLMAFYAGQLVRRPEMKNPTIIVLTDRNDLDDQLFSTFSRCRDLIRQNPIQAESREHLREVLERASGGVIFTTIQKFGPGPDSDTNPNPNSEETEHSLLTARRNVVVIADEAHRSQYGFKARLDPKTGKTAYGFAKYLRDALPNASFIGFTGTPIEEDDANTPRVFGNYIDIYDISRAVEDGVTVPIYYESRLARIELPEEKKTELDAAIGALTEDDDSAEEESRRRKYTAVEALVGAEPRVKMVAADLVRHFEERTKTLDGKAMVVCMSRRICVALHDEIVALRPDWRSDDDEGGKIKIVMTGAASDPEAWQAHVGGKSRRELLAKRARDPDDPLKLVLVRDMWLTGFDAPPMHTMYIDKPMRGHGLMQAIARVNRVFRDKPGGLIVDYIGIAQNLKHALGRYSAADRNNAGIDEAEAIDALHEKYGIVTTMFHGFDYGRGLRGAPKDRLRVMAEAMEWILDHQRAAAEKETSDADKKKAHRRYQDAVLALTKAFALAATSDAAREIRDAVGFFQAVRAILVKPTPGSGRSDADRQLAIRQIIDRSIVSTGIVDILAAAGLSRPDLSILSDEFLAEIGQMEKKNLALEALRKLLGDEIRSRSRTNIVETRKFSERLEQAVARYHTNAISTIEVLQELIGIAKDVREARARGETDNLSQDEIAFYDALADNDSAVEAMGNDSLKIIAHELLTSLKSNISVDWSHRENARARMRVLVKRILRNHGYPPDLQDSAVQTVLAQAEALSSMWAA